MNILTPDSKSPNLAAMRISTFHKERGDEVWLNMPIMPADKTYVSLLFDWTPYPAVCAITDEMGGPGVNPSIRLPKAIEACRPDYSLYPGMDYSLGYTYRACHRGCSFCKVKNMNEPTEHYSIWTFHDRRFRKIALLNNNTFEDPRWRETFEEIWAENLLVKDHSGYDARLMTEEKAEALSKTRFEGQLHTAWDYLKDEVAIMRGIGLMIEAGVKPRDITCYVLVGHDTTEEEDIYRIRMLCRLGVSPFAMPYNKKQFLRRPYARPFLRAATRPAITKGINWERVNTYKELVEMEIR